MPRHNKHNPSPPAAKRKKRKKTRGPEDGPKNALVRQKRRLGVSFALGRLKKLKFPTALGV
jgi:hypothetical protein